MTELKNMISKLMRRVRQTGNLPGSADIVSEAFHSLGYTAGNIQPRDVVSRFNDLLREVWEETLRVLERHEERAYAQGIPRELVEEYPDLFQKAEETAATRGFRAGVARLFVMWYPLLRQCFLSISQSRKQRGGKDFELQIEGLLTLGEIPFHKQERRYRTDLILPDVDTFDRNRNISVVVSVKRTLRERWSEVAEELFNLRSPNVFLFTADENVSRRHVNRICGQYNIHLVLWDVEKEEKFGQEPLVLGYTEWANSRLPVFRQHWGLGGGT